MWCPICHAGSESMQFRCPQGHKVQLTDKNPFPKTRVEGKGSGNPRPQRHNAAAPWKSIKAPPKVAQALARLAGRRENHLGRDQSRNPSPTLPGRFRHARGA